MWFFRSLTYLKAPSLWWLVRTVLFLAVFGIFEGVEFEWLGIQVFALKLAMIVFTLCAVVERWPVTLARLRSIDAAPFVPTSMFLITVFSALIWAPQVWHLQAAMLVGMAFNAAFTSLILLSTSDRELQKFPLGWAEHPQFARRALWLQSVLTALVLLIGVWVINTGTERDFVAFFVVVPFVMFYVFDWFMVLIVLTEPDDQV